MRMRESTKNALQPEVIVNRDMRMTVQYPQTGFSCPKGSSVARRKAEKSDIPYINYMIFNIKIEY